MMYYYITDYGILIVTVLITLIAQAFVSSSYSKYKKVKNKKGVTGAEVAREILAKNGLENIYVVEVAGNLTDHYDPSRKTVRLSKDIYNGTSVAAIAVASHECGHAIQDKENYTFLKIRAALVPLVNFSSVAGYIAILIGILFSSLQLFWIGILLEAVILVFQLVTLPVEFNASNRALKKIEEYDLVDLEELTGAKKMLRAAAFTYVASAATALLQILRLILLFGRDER